MRVRALGAIIVYTLYFTPISCVSTRVQSPTVFFFLSFLRTQTSLLYTPLIGLPKRTVNNMNPN